MEAPALAAAALAEGRDKRDAELALEVFAAAGPRFTESYRCGCVLPEGLDPSFALRLVGESISRQHRASDVCSLLPAWYLARIRSCICPLL